MSTLTTLRAAVCACLADDPAVIVYGFNPEAVSAPAAIVMPGDPYLESGAPGVPYGHYRVRFRVTVVAEVAPNDVASESIDGLIGWAVDRLAARFTVETVPEPFAFQANEGLHLAADLIVSDTTIIEE